MKYVFADTSYWWEALVVTCISICVVGFIGFIGATAVFGFNGLFIFWAVVLSLLAILFLASAARVNNVTRMIYKILATAKPSDFEAIGGREEWMEWVSSTNLAFELYNFVVTQAWLAGTAVTVSTTRWLATSTTSRLRIPSTTKSTACTLRFPTESTMTIEYPTHAKERRYRKSYTVTTFIIGNGKDARDNDSENR